MPKQLRPKQRKPKNVESLPAKHQSQAQGEKRIAVIDFETDPFEHGRIPRAFACGWYDGEVYRCKWGTERQVLRWAIERVATFSGIVYAHNGGKFDFIGYLFKVAKNKIHGRSALIIGNRLVKTELGQAEIRDSYAILPSPLKAYDKGEIDYGLFVEGVRERYKKRILDYLARDCRSLYGLVSRFISLHGVAPVTAASAGMRFLKKLCPIGDPLTDWQDKLLRDYYFGGRCQAFKPGVHRGLMRHYDIKSAYPFAMEHWHAIDGYYQLLSGKLIKEVKGSDFVFWRGIDHKDFPHRTKKGLFFGDPLSRDYYLTGWEWLAVMGKKKPDHVIRFSEQASFKKYVEHFFAEKEAAEKAGDKAGRLIAKIMLNAAYGKFAQRPDRFKDNMFVPVDAILTKKDELEGWQESYVDVKHGFAVWSRPSRAHGGYYNVATAASITGFVRAMLIRARQETDPIYFDTDCNITKSKMKEGHGLGSWSLEVEYDLLYVAGKKLYAGRLLPKYCKNKQDAKKKGYSWEKGRAWKISSKGVRLTADEMRRICEGETVTWNNPAPTYSLKSTTRFVTRDIKRNI